MKKFYVINDDTAVHPDMLFSVSPLVEADDCKAALEKHGDSVALQTPIRRLKIKKQRRNMSIVAPHAPV